MDIFKMCKKGEILAKLSLIWQTVGRNLSLWGSPGAHPIDSPGRVSCWDGEPIDPSPLAALEGAPPGTVFCSDTGLLAFLCQALFCCASVCLWKLAFNHYHTEPSAANAIDVFNLQPCNSLQSRCGETGIHCKPCISFWHLLHMDIAHVSVKWWLFGPEMCICILETKIFQALGFRRFRWEAASVWWQMY